MSTDTDGPSAAPERRGPEGLGAVDRAATILFTLASRPQGLGLAEICRETGLTMATAHRLLATLRKRNLVRETPDGLHALGAATLVLSGAFLDGLDVRREARRFLVSLHNDTDETCHLGVLASDQIVYIDKIDSTRRVRMVSQVGGTSPAFSTAIGKSFLAYASAEVLDDVLHETNRRRDEQVDAVVLGRVLAQDRTRGFSTDLEENEPGICCVGAPIMDNTGRVTAGLSVSTPRERFILADLDRIGANVRVRADEISRALGYQRPQ
jgi:IclR family acetate operon transcriptional repressor